MFTTLCCEHHYLLCNVHYCDTDITTQFLQLTTTAYEGGARAPSSPPPPPPPPPTPLHGVTIIIIIYGLHGAITFPPTLLDHGVVPLTTYVSNGESGGFH